jgi:hypothetical protein
MNYFKDKLVKLIIFIFTRMLILFIIFLAFAFNFIPYIILVIGIFLFWLFEL